MEIEICENSMELEMAAWSAYLHDIEHRGYVTSPNRLVQKAMSMDGFSYNKVHDLNQYVAIAVEVIERWSEDEMDDFGSSDFTFLLKEYLEELGLVTEFNPYLTIVKTAA